jgi:drug/metabolite transporter (DMT)-like permease
MHSSRTLRIKTFVLLFLMVAFGSVGNTLLDKGMKDVGSLNLSSASVIWAGLQLTFSNATVWLGILCMLCFMICHMLVLSWADYSFVMPFSAVAYALVPLLGYLWLHETVPVTRWIGIALILLGVILVSRTPPRTTKPAATPLPAAPR